MKRWLVVELPDGHLSCSAIWERSRADHEIVLATHIASGHYLQGWVVTAPTRYQALKIVSKDLLPRGPLLLGQGTTH